jgi:hypothetical protein
MDEGEVARWRRSLIIATQDRFDLTNQRRIANDSRKKGADSGARLRPTDACAQPRRHVVLPNAVCCSARIRPSERPICRARTGSRLSLSLSGNGSATPGTIVRRSLPGPNSRTIRGASKLQRSSRSLRILRSTARRSAPSRVAGSHTMRCPGRVARHRLSRRSIRISFSAASIPASFRSAAASPCVSRGNSRSIGAQRF